MTSAGGGAGAGARDVRGRVLHRGRVGHPAGALWRAASIAALAALVLTACDRPVPKPSPSVPFPSVSASPTPSVSPSASPTLRPGPPPDKVPEKPAAMDDDGPRGAIATAKYFMDDLYGFVYATGDFSGWEALSRPNCLFCADVVKQAKEMHAKHQWQEPAAVAWIGEPKHDYFPQSDIHRVVLRGRQGRSRIFDKAGDVVKVEPGVTATLTVFVVEIAGEWRIRGVAVKADT